ncbi:MAG TPA: hypothetical protein VED63_03390 [Acidimicrobiales bacterium]|nr:hypothetical protein [Acidimicrobiales bacterium]
MASTHRSESSYTDEEQSARKSGEGVTLAAGSAVAEAGAGVATVVGVGTGGVATVVGVGTGVVGTGGAGTGGVATVVGVGIGGAVVAVGVAPDVDVSDDTPCGACDRC